jgi:hypothetical protein
LLHERDSLGIEQFRKGYFMFSDSDASLESSFSPSYFRGDRISLSPSCKVGGSDSRIGASDVFVWLTVTHKNISTFEGWAFDASIASSLYCGNGFVLGNCRCAFVPAFPGDGAKTTKPQVDAAIQASIKQEIPTVPKEGGGRRKATTKEAQDRSKWIGKEKRISKGREE